MVINALETCEVLIHVIQMVVYVQMQWWTSTRMFKALEHVILIQWYGHKSKATKLCNEVIMLYYYIVWTLSIDDTRSLVPETIWWNVWFWEWFSCSVRRQAWASATGTWGTTKTATVWIWEEEGQHGKGKWNLNDNTSTWNNTVQFTMVFINVQTFGKLHVFLGSGRCESIDVKKVYRRSEDMCLGWVISSCSFECRNCPFFGFHLHDINIAKAKVKAKQDKEAARREAAKAKRDVAR